MGTGAFEFKSAADRDLQKLHEKFWKRVAKDFLVVQVQIVTATL